jgi:hypothetical protein
MWFQTAGAERTVNSLNDLAGTPHNNIFITISIAAVYIELSSSGTRPIT